MNTHINMCFHEYDIHGYLSACRFETENPLVYYYIIFVVDSGDTKFFGNVSALQTPYGIWNFISQKQ
jgi:hypothetical protein